MTLPAISMQVLALAREARARRARPSRWRRPCRGRSAPGCGPARPAPRRTGVRSPDPWLRAAARARRRWCSTCSRMASAWRVDHLGQRAGLALGLGQHHRDRRLQRVGQVADVGALALDDLLVVGHQGVQLVGQGRQLGRIVGRDRRSALPWRTSATSRRRANSGCRPTRTWMNTAAIRPGAQQHQGDGGGRRRSRATSRSTGRAVLGGHEDHRRGAARQLGHAWPRPAAARSAGPAVS